MAFFVCIFLMVIGGSATAAPRHLASPDPGIVEEARSLVDAMKRNERGPYSRIRWFCNDGTSHPPKPYACAERGGGRQHAEYSRDRQRLSELGWHVGTVITALEWAEIWNPDERHARLRELPLESYMVETGDGWVLRRARLYRGRVQLEDEERAGRELLLKLLSQPGWLRENFLLARELTRVLPHGGTEDRTRTVRHLAQELAEKTPAFDNLRIEVHSRPNAGSAQRVRDWLRTTVGLTPEISEKAAALAQALDALYGASGRARRLKDAAKALGPQSGEAAALIRDAESDGSPRRLRRIARAMALLRQEAWETEARSNLLRLDLLQELEAELRTSALEYLTMPALTRRQHLTLAVDLLEAAWGAGLLSSGEKTALVTPLTRILETAEPLGADAYLRVVRRLSLAAGWAALSVRHAFYEPLQKYIALEPEAGRFVDEILRGSVLLPLGEIAHLLSVDAARFSGQSHRFFGSVGTGLLGMNPGVARGRLRVMEDVDFQAGRQPRADEIVVLVRTIVDLPPVAGILTLGEGNPLSHVQMLARNLGIPNVSLSPRLLPRLREEAGKEVLLAVAGDGRVLLDILEPAPDEPADRPNRIEKVAVEKVDAPRPDLSIVRPLGLDELHSGLSGRLVGPKAANIGELNRLFPGRIAQAVALPFGVFAAHTVPQRNRIANAFDRHRAGELDLAGLEKVLDEVRADVAGIELDLDIRIALTARMQESFGAPGGYGVFVRSDTNVEDLPEFTGAGLNETVPNVVGFEKQLSAVARVWSSVYSRRAMSWRARILRRPEEVYASVLLMKSVPSEKSGVLVTADVATGGEGLTVSTAWGVGGAVDNESAATLVMRSDGSNLLVAEAKAAYQRRLSEEGGVRWVPAPAGPVLTPAEQDDLRRLAEEVKLRYPPVFDGRGAALPWDIEFAFAGGKLWLLQIRPLVQRGNVEAQVVVDARVPPAKPSGAVILEEPPANTAETKQ